MFPLYTSHGRSRFFTSDIFLRRPRRRNASSLLSGLVAHWKLDEASGTRYDSVLHHDLTPHGAVAQVEGKVGPYAAQFVPDTNDYLSALSTAALRMGAIDFTIAGWLEFDAVSPAGLIGKWDNGSLEYLVGCDGNNFCFSVSPDGLTPVTVSDTTSLEGGTWYHFAAWHDSGNQTLNLSINHASPASAQHETGVFAGNADLNLGRDAQAGNYFAGRLNSVSIWKRLLSDAERTSLYNEGQGLAYPF